VRATNPPHMAHFFFKLVTAFIDRYAMLSMNVCFDASPVNATFNLTQSSFVRCTCCNTVMFICTSKAGKATTYNSSTIPVLQQQHDTVISKASTYVQVVCRGVGCNRCHIVVLTSVNTMIAVTSSCSLHT
jgi:hypothetical protein